MYFPPDFDRQRAIELAKLNLQAYQQFASFKKGQPWAIQDGYTLICEVTYKTFLSFSPGDEQEASTTAIDREMEAELASQPVSFGLEDLLRKDIPMGFIAAKDGAAFLVFRGTVTVREWLFDLDIAMQDYRLKGFGKVSSGFQTIYRRCRESFMPALGNLAHDTPLFIAGHSLGGALALLSLPDVVQSTHFKAPTLYNFGCPRVGDAGFARAYNQLPGQKTLRVVNNSDVTTAIPLPAEIPLLPGGYFTHVDQSVEFNTQANDLNTNHAMETYLAELEK